MLLAVGACSSGPTESQPDPPGVGENPSSTFVASSTGGDERDAAAADVEEAVEDVRDELVARDQPALVAGTDLEAMQDELRALRAILVEHDAAIRAIDTPGSVTPEVNAYLEAIGTDVADIDRGLEAETLEDYREASATSGETSYLRWVAANELLVALGLDPLGPAEVGDELSADGEVLLEESFGDEAHGWFIDTVSDGEFATVGEAYEITVERPGRTLVSDSRLGDEAADPQLETLTDVSTEVTVVRAAAPYGVFGLTCRQGADGGAHYQGVIDTSGYWAIAAVGDSDDRTILAEGDAPEAVTFGDGPNRIRLDCVDADEGAELTLFVNGNAVGAVTDPDPLPAGAVGLLVGSAEQGGVIGRFDDLVITGVG